MELLVSSCVSFNVLSAKAGRRECEEKVARVKQGQMNFPHETRSYTFLVISIWLLDFIITGQRQKEVQSHIITDY